MVQLITLALAILAVALSGFAWMYSKAAVEHCIREQSESKALAELAKLSSEVTGLADAYAALMESHRKLRSRIGMRDLRKRRDDDDLPDSSSDPAAYKRELRSQLAKAGKLNAKFHIT